MRLTACRELREIRTKYDGRCGKYTASKFYRLVSINVVTLRQARLVPGWVTVFGRVNHLGAELGTQVRLSHPSMGRRSEYPAKAGE